MTGSGLHFLVTGRVGRTRDDGTGGYALILSNDVLEEIIFTRSDGCVLFCLLRRCEQSTLPESLREHVVEKGEVKRSLKIPLPRSRGNACSIHVTVCLDFIIREVRETYTFHLSQPRCHMAQRFADGRQERTQPSPCGLHGESLEAKSSVRIMALTVFIQVQSVQVAFLRQTQHFSTVSNVGRLKSIRIDILSMFRCWCTSSQ